MACKLESPIFEWAGDLALELRDLRRNILKCPGFDGGSASAKIEPNTVGLRLRFGTSRVHGQFGRYACGMPSFSQAYFVVAGLTLLSAGIAVVVDFRGLGKRWEHDVNGYSAAVSKVARLPWPTNPYLGQTLRPVAGIFAIVLGIVMVGSVLLGAIH